MQILIELYRKLKILYRKYFNSSYNQRSKIIKDNIKGSITFNLYEDSNVDIFCYIPETKDMNNENLMKEAENFGNFVSSITDGLVSDTIVKLLDKTKANSQDPNEQLFIENILFFWAMSHVNRKAETDKKPSKPLIKPTSVFAQTKYAVD